ncbi:bsl8076 [Bradyrhizobium diazoefficiens USDA 110]|uniref:Bsl8076 protein n=1 Tax=Bradyrhizobium diazoefficiens (strain JCM 10833 / BCRC 13528 / IAM 13628 / NBRC 14792 / USDA 110) TaxID=224911 RepID=Q89BS2_BRADU|nr:hypothetical protein Bdiaspc4_42755 [Bradyrhizobium diazoefficiens]BAC53341.1 bsl8076 [Bradyrhizobium diazoefficiens USDA 110]
MTPHTLPPVGLFVNFAPHLGFPALSVPNEMRGDGLPSGLMIIGQAGDDGLLVDVAERLAARFAAARFRDPVAPPRRMPIMYQVTLCRR